MKDELTLKELATPKDVSEKKFKNLAPEDYSPQKEIEKLFDEYDISVSKTYNELINAEKIKPGILNLFHSKVLNFIDSNRVAQTFTISGYPVEIRKGKIEKNVDSVEDLELKEVIISMLLQKKKHEVTESLANFITSNNRIYTTRHDKNSEMWIYQEGIYVPQGRSYIKEQVRRYTSDGFTTHLCNEVINKIEADTFISQEDLFKDEYPHLICVENGLLDIELRRLEPYTPNKRFFAKMPIKYDASKKCPKIDEFFLGVLNEKEKVKLIEEMFGRTLSKRYFPKRAVMFYNTGDGAKSTVENLLKKFVGIDNISSVSLARLNDTNFGLDDLHKKHVNLAGEISNEDLKDTSTFKSLTGGDEISAKRKFLTDLKFVNHALLVFACNELPRVYDTSLGFWNRWILLEFPNVFLRQDEYDNSNNPNKKVANPNILDYICTVDEMSGLLNKALGGLERLKKEGDFTYTKNSKEVMNTWMRTADSFLAFCTDYVEESSLGEISKSYLRQKYREYCKKHKVRGVGDKSIKITLSELFGATDDRIWMDDAKRQKYVWVGVKFKDKKMDKKIHIDEY